jgi:RNA polymerase sigma factor (sigma-70 family)
MTAEPLDALLEKLCNGDMTAAEEAFVAYEPFLRKVVRKLLPQRVRSKFDSIDVVQSVWADVLNGFRQAGWRFKDAAHLRSFLVQVTRHRFIDQVRHHRSALLREQPLTGTDPEQMPASKLPRPSEIVQADDLWRKMLSLCPPAHHEVLRLKRQGLTMDEIGALTGLHEGSVRRILRQLAREMAVREGASCPPSAESS